MKANKIPQLRNKQGFPFARKALTTLAGATIVSLIPAFTPSRAMDLDRQRVGSWPGFSRGSVTAPAVAGNYVYAAAESLPVIDVSNPANPQQVSGLDTSGSANPVTVSGNYAYLADGPAGLQLIDISNQANPQRVGGYSTGGWANLPLGGRFASACCGHERKRG